MFCSSCGFRLQDGDRFCSSCGAKVEFLPPTDAIDATVRADLFAHNVQRNPNAHNGLLFDEREPSYNNAIQEPQTEERITVQQEKENRFRQPDPLVPKEPEMPTEPELSAVKHPLLSDKDEPVSSQAPVEKETESADSEPTTETEPSESEQETQVADKNCENGSSDEVDAATFINEDVGVSEPEKDSQESVAVEPSEESAAVEQSESDDTVVYSSENEKTVIAFKDDTYNVYSGAVPGISSQDFRYPTNDNAYPDLPAGSAPQFGDMAQQFDDDSTICVDYIPPAVISANQQDDDYQNGYPHNYGNYGENFVQQNGSDVPAKEPEKSKSATWIIIACISIIIIAIGATCAVILTQYDSFGDFFASFSDGDKADEEAEEETDEENHETDKTETETETTELVTELTTIEPTTMPPTTEKMHDGDCGAQVYYDYDEASGVLIISGMGEMQNYANAVTPWAGKDVRRVEIGEGVTSITPGAFTEITPDAIYLSSTVSSFDVLAVNKFGGIEVNPSNRQYKSVNGVLFDKSGTILIAYPNQKINTSYAVPEGVKIIDELAFYEATNLNSLSISSTVEYIDNYALKGCINIHRLEVPANVTEIRSGAFYGWLDSQEIYVANPETKVVEDWNDGCNANVTVAS